VCYFVQSGVIPKSTILHPNYLLIIDMLSDMEKIIINMRCNQADNILFSEFATIDPKTAILDQKARLTHNIINKLKSLR
jgi:hypothetical protein